MRSEQGSNELEFLSSGLVELGVTLIERVGKERYCRYDVRTGVVFIHQWSGCIESELWHTHSNVKPFNRFVVRFIRLDGQNEISRGASVPGKCSVPKSRAGSSHNRHIGDFQGHGCKVGNLAKYWAVYNQLG